MTTRARAWRALRADRMLFASAVAAFLLVAAISVGPPVLSHLLGHTSDEPFP